MNFLAVHLILFGCRFAVSGSVPSFCGVARVFEWKCFCTIITWTHKVSAVTSKHIYVRAFILRYNSHRCTAGVVCTHALDGSSPQCNLWLFACVGLSSLLSREDIPIFGLPTNRLRLVPTFQSAEGIDRRSSRSFFRWLHFQQGLSDCARLEWECRPVW